MIAAMIDRFIGYSVTRPTAGRRKSEASLAERKRVNDAKWRHKNADKLKANKKAHYLANADDLRAKARDRHHRQNSERDIQRITAWKDANPNRVARSRLLKNAKVRATALGLDFDLTLEDITLPDVCPVLGIEIVFGRGQVQPGSPTVDRIVPEKGYVKGNVCVISHRANQIKSNGTIAEHEAVLRYMRERA